MSWIRNFLGLALLAFACGCTPATTSVTGPPATQEQPIVLLSVTSDASQQPQSVDMAMKLAGFSLDEGRRVVMFFNVQGVTLPTRSFPDDAAFQQNSPLKEQLAKLIERGVDVHVCPICMKALGVEESDVMEGAKVTTRPSLFANIGANTAVFTY
ncbi:MAG: DsrE family protein [Pirellulaceae bacterium]|nr:DsrE family protein [Pirellulaceae bacterium]